MILINWNIYSLFYVIFSAINITILSITATIVHGKELYSKANRLFLTSLIFMINTFIWFPMGGIFWSVLIFGNRLILITTRIFQFSSFSSVLMLYWCSRVLRDGEYTWNSKINILLISVSLLVYTLATLTPDAVYIVNGPPNTDEIDTGEGIIFQIVFYPGTCILLFGSLIHFLQTYFYYKNDDPDLSQQALLLSVGISLGIVGLLTSFLSTLLVAHVIMAFLFLSLTAGILIMAFGFTKEPGFLKMRITNELRRLIVLLERGKTFNYTAQLAFLSDLVEKENSITMKTMLLVLEGIILTMRSELALARKKFEIARATAKKNNMVSILSDIKRHMQHLEVQEIANLISTNLSKSTRKQTEEDSLDKALEYLDQIIELRGN